MQESTIQNQIRLDLSSDKSLVFRTNAGDFWQGDLIYSQEFKQRVLINLRKIDGLPAGFTDLIYIGDKGEIAFIETKKATGKTRQAQIKFINRLHQLGHRAGIARSVEDAKAIVKGSQIKNE